MRRLRKWNPIINRSTLRSMLILLSIILSMPFYIPNAFADFPGCPDDFGAVLVGTQKCDSSVLWVNISPGGSLECGSNGCVCSPPEVTRTAHFSTDGGGFSVTPSSATVPGCGSTNVKVCVSPSEGDYTQTLTASLSPAFYGGYTTDTCSLHVKGIPSLVTCEPLGSSLNLGSAEIGQIVYGYFQVCNYNTSSVTINSISLSDDIDFFVQSGVGSVISPNGSCQSVSIGFTPQATGNFNANIQVNTTAQNPSYTCSGIGTQGPTITTSSSGSGAITSTTSVNYGSNFTIVMTPSTGNTLSKMTDNGTDMTSYAMWNGSQKAFNYTLQNITSNHTVQATFGTLNISYGSTGGGTVSQSPTTVTLGGSVTFTMTPSTGNTLISLTDNGGSVQWNTGNGVFTYTISPVISSHTIQATFGTPPPPSQGQGPALSIFAASFWLLRR